MTDSKHINIRDFLPHVLPLPEMVSDVGLSKLIFQDGLHPNNYALKYYLRAKGSGKQTETNRVVAKLDPNLPSRTTVVLMEHFSAGIGYEVILQFEPLEGQHKADRIDVTVEYQVYL